jgi:hypothetical protein
MNMPCQNKSRSTKFSLKWITISPEVLEAERLKLRLSGFEIIELWERVGSDPFEIWSNTKTCEKVQINITGGLPLICSVDQAHLNSIRLKGLAGRVTTSPARYVASLGTGGGQ